MYTELSVQNGSDLGAGRGYEEKIRGDEESGFSSGTTAGLGIIQRSNWYQIHCHVSFIYFYNRVLFLCLSKKKIVSIIFMNNGISSAIMHGLF